MARFCTKCGKPLEEGEVCTCEQEAATQTQQVPFQQAQQQAAPQMTPEQLAQQQAVAQQQQQFQQTQQAVAGVAKRVFGAILNVLRSPVVAGRQIILAGDVVVSLILIALQGIFTTIFGVVAAKKVCGFIGGGMYSWFGEELKVPYVKIIFGTLIISILLSVVLAVLLWVASLIVKNGLNFQQALSAAAVRSSVTIITTILAIILFLINASIGILLFVTGTVWGFFIIISAVPAADDKTKDKLPLALIIVFFIFTGITAFTMNKASGLYVPSSDYEDSLGDLEDWF